MTASTRAVLLAAFSIGAMLVGAELTVAQEVALAADPPKVRVNVIPCNIDLLHSDLPCECPDSCRTTRRQVHSTALRSSTPARTMQVD